MLSSIWISLWGHNSLSHCDNKAIHILSALYWRKMSLHINQFVRRVGKFFNQLAMLNSPSFCRTLNTVFPQLSFLLMISEESIVDYWSMILMIWKFREKLEVWKSSLFVKNIYTHGVYLNFFPRAFLKSSIFLKLGLFWIIWGKILEHFIQLVCFVFSANAQFFYSII